MVQKANKRSKKVARRKGKPDLQIGVESKPQTAISIPRARPWPGPLLKPGEKVGKKK